MYDLLHYGRINDGSIPYSSITEIARGWRRSIRAMGGYWLGTYTLSIEDLTREDLLWWYRHCMADEIIEKTAGVTTWQGLVFEMELVLDGVRYRRTMDKEWWHNRVNVYYQNAGEQTSVGWSEVSGSSDIYGRMDYIDSVGESTAAEAAALRDRHLSDYGYPRSRTIGGLEFNSQRGQKPFDSLSVVVAGLIFTMNWRYREVSLRNNAASTALTTLVGDTEYISIGTIETNTMGIDAECRTPQRLWDLAEKIILAGDPEGYRWVGGVYADHKFNYNQAATAIGFEKHGDILRRLNASSDILPTTMVADFILRDANAPIDDTPVDGTVLDNPRNQWIEEVEFVAPNGIILKPLGFEDVHVLLRPSGIGGHIGSQ